MDKILHIFLAEMERFKREMERQQEELQKKQEEDRRKREKEKNRLEKEKADIKEKGMDVPYSLIIRLWKGFFVFVWKFRGNSCKYLAAEIY